MGAYPSLCYGLERVGKEHRTFRDWSVVFVARISFVVTQMWNLRHAQLVSVRILFLSYSVFLIGFFVFPNKPDYYEYFYWAILPFGAIVGPRAVKLLRRSRLFWWIAGYAAYTFLAGLWSQPFVVGDFLFHSRRILYVLAFILVTVALLEEYPEKFWSLLKVNILVGAITALVGIVLWYRVHPFPETRLWTVGKFEAPIEAACGFGFFGLLAVNFAVQEGKVAIRVGLMVCAAVILAFVILSQSRIGLISFSVAAIMLSLRRQPKVALLLLVVFLAALLGTWTFAPELWGHLTRGVPYRPGIWGAVLENALNSPVFGHGSLADRTVVIPPNTFVHAHSPFLASLRDGGIIGLTLLVGMLGYAGLLAFRFRRGRQEAELFTFWVFLMLCILANTDRFFGRPSEIWMYFWLPMVFIMWREVQERSKT